MCIISKRLAADIQCGNIHIYIRFHVTNRFFALSSVRNNYLKF